jgi:hypothetical protein
MGHMASTSAQTGSQESTAAERDGFMELRGYKALETNDGSPVRLWTRHKGP